MTFAMSRDQPLRCYVVGSNKQDYRDAVARINARGWRVDEERRGYPLAFCPCGKSSHMKTIHRTPSTPNYWKNLDSWFDRLDPCDPKEEP